MTGAEMTGASLVEDPEPLPSDVSPHGLRRGLLRIGGVVAIAAVVVTLGPGLGELRSRFAQARPVWIVIARDQRRGGNDAWRQAIDEDH